MNVIDALSWDEFESHVRSIPQGHELLFRGHEDSDWELKTTLERSGNQKFLVKDYYRLIRRIKPQIQTFTSLKWDMPSDEDIQALTRDYNSFDRGVHNLPAYTYMVYLRHNGFPSPLLDWTRSVYVAAYFAFRRPSKERVSIYMYASPRLQITDSAEPQIVDLGRYVQTHKRHFLQQSGYTLCFSYLKDRHDSEDGVYFVAHDEVFNRAQPGLISPRPDALCKFNLPAEQRTKVLRLLDEYNLNAYSLFGSDESLMETMAFRELHLKHALSEPDQGK